MSRSKRAILFVISIAGIGIIFGIFNFDSQLSSIPKVIIISSLIMLSFSTLFIEHFFATPSDVLASSLSIMLLLAPAKSSLSNFGIWYNIYYGYVFLFFLLSFLALQLLDSGSPSNSLRNSISNQLKRFVVFFGNGRWLFASLFLITLIFYVDNQSILFIVLSFYSAIIILIDPKKYTLNSLKTKKQLSDVGEIIGVQSRNTFLAKLFKDHTPIRRFDLVEFKYSMDDSEKIFTGLVIDNYLLNEQQWIKILSSKEIRSIIKSDNLKAKHENNVVYTIKNPDKHESLKRLVGIVEKDSNIGKLRFEFGGNVKIQEGDLLEVVIGPDVILYQVVQGITDEETLESKNVAGFIIGEAIQLGTWDSDRLLFNKYGWVPEINTPLFQASSIDDIDVPDDEIKIGNIPSTNFPVLFNTIEGITHHLAILGVTGTGKSVFSRFLIKNIIEQNVKVICVDFTNEYRSKFTGLKSVINNDIEDKLFEQIDLLSLEKSKFKNTQDQKVINDCQSYLLENIKESIQVFINSDQKIGLFELPDVENTTGILDYTRWFFKCLFILARKGELKKQKICVVLEEAHTVIPEWNFIGVEEKTAQSLVNAIGQIALQGRKYNVGFVIIAQRTANVSKTVLTQCNSIIAFQQFDKTSCDFLSNYMDEQYTKSLSTLKFRHAIAVGRGFRTGAPMIFEVPEINEET